jgi:hypothetical protein
MKHLMTALCILFLTNKSFSQNTLTADGFKFKQGNKSLSLKEAHLLIQNNTNANQTMWEARSKRSNSFILGGFSAVGVGIPVYSVIKNNSISWFFTQYTIPLMIGGITCGVFSVKANLKGKKYASEAVNQFNQSKKIGYNHKPKSILTFGNVDSGIGIRVDF